MNKVFTFIELMAVIGVISVICALLMPSLLLAGKHGKNTGCKSLLKQYAFATAMYASDYDEVFPDIRRFLAPEYGFLSYMGTNDAPDENITRCPADGTTENMNRMGLHSFKGKIIKISIGGTVNLSDSNSATTGGKGFFIQSGKDPILNREPSRRCQWTDTQRGNKNNAGHAMSIGKGYGKQSTILAEYVFRHVGNTSNGAFCDGHVSPIKINESSLPVNFGHDLRGMWYFPGNCTWPYGPRQGPPRFPETKMQKGITL